MARIRTIKPDFFKHEGLFDAELETGLPLRLAFAGLWTQCDREGRFAWRPRKLKSDVLPYDDVDFSRVLNAFVEHGFVERYEADGQAYGVIPSWDKHQVVNSREAKSVIPAPSDAQEMHVHAHARDENAHSKQVHAQGEREGEQEKEGESKERAPTPRDELLSVLDDEQAGAVLEHRQRIRKPLTARAARLLAKKLAQCPDPSAAADLMIERGWAAVEPEWVANRGADPPQDRIQAALDNLDLPDDRPDDPTILDLPVLSTRSA